LPEGYRIKIKHVVTSKYITYFSFFDGNNILVGLGQYCRASFLRWFLQW